MQRALRLPVLLVAALLVSPVAPPASPARAASGARKLLDAYFTARKDDQREKAWQEILAAPPLEADEVADLAERAVEHVRKRGRRIGSGRETWFDVEKDGFEGLYLTSGKGRKGLVLALHGGGAGSGDAGSAQSAFQGGIASLGMRGLYPEVLEKTEYGWTVPAATERWIIEELVPAAIRTWDVDPDRVYVTGHSMGGYGTWTYGAIHADRFAAGAAFAGAPTVYWLPGQKDKAVDAVVEGYLPNLYNLPLFVYQSLDDPNVPAAANVFACARLAELHAGDARGWKHVYEQVDGRGHAFPEKGAGPGLEWMAGHVRETRPATIRWQPVRDWKTRFYWLRWGKPWLGSELVATLDRDRNAVDIVIEKPRTATPQRTEEEREAHVATSSVHLGERLLDLEREVVVTVDGKVRFRGPVGRSLATLVRTAEEREDPAYVFAAEAAIGPVLEERTETD